MGVISLGIFLKMKIMRWYKNTKEIGSIKSRMVKSYEYECILASEIQRQSYMNVFAIGDSIILHLMCSIFKPLILSGKLMIICHIVIFSWLRPLVIAPGEDGVVDKLRRFDCWLWIVSKLYKVLNNPHCQVYLYFCVKLVKGAMLHYLEPFFHWLQVYTQ